MNPSTTRDLVRTHRPAALILAAFVGLGVVYSCVTPVFEAGDEIWHYPFVQHLATGHGLPIQEPGVATLWEQEGGQPPLYYALAALGTFWIDTRDLPDRLWINPHARIGIPLLYGNKNLIVHTSAENFPWQNTALAVHLIRLFSVLLAAITAALTYALGLEIRPGDRRLAAVAAALVAFNPMFLFISASVNNDNLAVMLAALALLLMARLLTRGATMPRFIALGIVLGLAALSKVSDAGLMLAAGCVMIVLLAREIGLGRGSRAGSATKARAVLLGCIVCAALVIVIAGWWYARNWLLYGDPLAFNVWAAIAGGRPAPITPLGLLGEFQGLRISYWGNWGGVNLIAPDWVYVLLDGWTVLAAIGLALGLARRTLPRLLALPALWVALISAGLIRWTLLTLASQGRLLFPGIGAIAILLACGLQQIAAGLDAAARSVRGRGLVSSLVRLARAVSDALAPALALFLFVFAVATPWVFIAPAYALPLRGAADAETPHPVHIVFADRAELVGYALPQRSAAPGGELPVTLYWRALAPIDEDWSVYIRLFDASGRVIGRWDAFPGNGLYPTRLWRTDEQIVDTYRVPVAADAVGPAVGRVEAGLFRRRPVENLAARDPMGNPVTPTLARFRIAGRVTATVENPTDIRFGESLGLVGYGLAPAVPGSTFTVRLYWRAYRPMAEDYTVFVHLVDAAGQIVAQRDNPPRHGELPTSFWEPGEVVPDEYLLDIPPNIPHGDYAVEVGVYREGDGTRLPVRGGDHIVLERVRVALGLSENKLTKQFQCGKMRVTE